MQQLIKYESKNSELIPDEGQTASEKRRDLANIQLLDPQSSQLEGISAQPIISDMAAVKGEGESDGDQSSHNSHN